MSAMPAPVSAVTTADIAALHERLTRYVHGHFRRKLSVDDASDAASEALAELDRARCDGHVIGDPQRWLRRAAWRNAVDAIRKIEGEGKVRRERPADLADHLDRLADASTAVEVPLLEAAASRADADALSRALRRLKPDEHRVLQLRYFDGLDVPAILDVLGCSRHHYENVHKRAVHRLRTALVDSAEHESCRECRSLLLGSALAGIGDLDVARRDAHLEACLACRAYARRQRGLLAALPLPALTVLGRLAQRWHAATAAAAAPAATAAVTTTGAAKIAATVCGVGVLAAGVCTGAKELEQHHRPSARTAKRSAVAPASETPSSAPSTVRASYAAPPGRRDASSVPAGGRSGAANQDSRTSRATSSAGHRAARLAGGAQSSEFLPSGTPVRAGTAPRAVQGSRQATATAATTPPLSASTASRTSPTAAPTSGGRAQRAQSDTSSSGEFAP